MFPPSAEEPKSLLHVAWTANYASFHATPQAKVGGRYTIWDTLEVSDERKVFRAFDPWLHRHVVLTTAGTHLLTNEERAQFLNWACCLSSLRHPNIAMVHDLLVEDDGPLFVVSQFVEGLPLFSRMRQHRMTHQRSAAYVAQVADALHYAYCRQMTLRTISPRQLMVDAEGNAFLSDFVNGRRRPAVMMNGSSEDALAYTSPELVKSVDDQDAGPADVFSLGVILYELLTGRHPFHAETLEETRRLIVEENPPRPSFMVRGVPEQLEEVCLTAMAASKSDRYAGTDELSKGLREFLKAT